MQIRLIVVGYLEFMLGAIGFILLLPQFQIAIRDTKMSAVMLLVTVSAMVTVWGLTLTLKSSVVDGRREIISLRRTNKAISAILAAWLVIAIVVHFSPITGGVVLVVMVFLYLAVSASR